jgi:hypothetical protein
MDLNPLTAEPAAGLMELNPFSIVPNALPAAPDIFPEVSVILFPVERMVLSVFFIEVCASLNFCLSGSVLAVIV